MKRVKLNVKRNKFDDSRIFFLLVVEIDNNKFDLLKEETNSTRKT